MIDAAVLVNAAYDAGLKPPPELTVSEWADEHRWIGAAVSPEPGPWHTERVPYMREVMDVLSPAHPARSVVLMKGSQIGGTEGSLNWVGHTVYFGLGSMLIVLPTQETAKEWSKQRLSQLIEDTECLRGKVLDQKRRDSGNTYFSKKYSGGFIKIAWSTSAKKLRSTPAPFIIADETDGMDGDVQGEGDPIALLKRRFSNYPRGKFLPNLHPYPPPPFAHRARIPHRRPALLLFALPFLWPLSEAAVFAAAVGQERTWNGHVFLLGLQDGNPRALQDADAGWPPLGGDQKG